MQEDRGKEPVELVRPFRVQERYHSADVVQTLHLRAQRRFLVEVSVDKITVFLRGNPAHPVNPDAARMADYFAHHVLRHLIFVAADGKVASLTAIFAVKNCSFFFLQSNT